MLEVGSVQRVPAVLGALEQRLPEHPTGVVDQDRHGTELGGRLPERGVDLRRVADIGGDAEPAYLGGSRRAHGVVLLPDGHTGPEGGQPVGDAAADARAAAGHHGDLPSEHRGVRVENHPAKVPALIT